MGKKIPEISTINSGHVFFHPYILRFNFGTGFVVGKVEGRNEEDMFDTINLLATGILNSSIDELGYVLLGLFLILRAFGGKPRTH